MQRTFDKLYRQENSTQLKWAVGIAAAFGLIMLALGALTWNSPVATSWVSDAAQAEFAGTMAAESPVRIAVHHAH
jgi:hypothetical protein